jgi:hypothetical protein
VRINTNGYKLKLTISVGNKCIPKKLLNSALSILVFFRSIYLKSSCSKPSQLIIQFLVNLNAQKIIGVKTRNFTIKVFSKFSAKYNAIGIGATDQKGSYKLEFFKITLPI